MNTERVISDIADERNRQIDELGCSTMRDDEYKNGELAGAAACYAMYDLRIENTALSADRRLFVGRLWPWAEHYFKPRTARENLVRAAALIVAEIERLDRAEIRKAEKAA